MSLSMYPIPDDFDVKCFIGAKLYEFCMNANQIRLKFNTGLQIVVEGRMILRLSANSDDLLAISPQSPSLDFYSLVEAEVISVHLSHNRMNLRFDFPDGQTLDLIGDDPYECYRIQSNDRELIV